MSSSPRSIHNQFNISADTQVEKRIQSYRLNPTEREAIDKIRNVARVQEQAENSSFKNPTEYKKKLNEKIQELQNQRTNTGNPTHEYHPTGGPSRSIPQQGQSKPLPRHKLILLADSKVREDHQAKIKEVQQTRDNRINSILQNAADNGRGPEQTQDQNRSLSQEFNQNQQSLSQQFNRSR